MSGKEVEVLRQGLSDEAITRLHLGKKEMAQQCSWYGAVQHHYCMDLAMKTRLSLRIIKQHPTTGGPDSKLVRKIMVSFLLAVKKKTLKYSRARVRWDVPFNYLGPFTVLYLVFKSEELRANQIWEFCDSFDSCSLLLTEKSNFFPPRNNRKYCTQLLS